MIQQPTLYVLAEAAEIGLPEAATVPARAFDPVLRPFITRKVSRSVDAARARTTSRHGEHVLRLAFLDVHGGAPADLDPNDERAVEQAFHTLAAPFLPPREDPALAPPRGGAYRASAADREPGSFSDNVRRPKRRWPITVPAALVLLLGVVATLAVLVVPRLWPTPGARFGRTAFGRALGEPLTDVVVAQSRGGDADARALLLAPEVKKQIGADAFASLERAVDELPHVGSDGERSIDQALAPLYLEINELDAKLATAKVPAHLHAYGSFSAGRPVVWLTSYFVERRDELGFDGAPMRFVWGRRIDGLNLSESRLYKATAEDWAILSMDRLEEEFVQTLLAPLATGATMLPDASAPEAAARAELGRVAGRVVATELTSAAKVSRSDAASLHRAIAQRNAMAGSLSKLGYRVPATSGIELSASTVRRITRARDRGPPERGLLEDLLRMNDVAMSYRRDVAAAVAVLARLEEEELGGTIIEQKRLADDAAPAPGALRGSARARAVAASSLAILARSRECTTLSLWRLVRPLFDGDAVSGTTRGATKVLLKHLGLGLQADPSTFDEPDALERALIQALEFPPARLRDAADATYKELFGRAPPSLSRRTLP